MHPYTPKPKVLFFDVNETLLDIGPPKERVGDILLDAGAPELWFTTMLQYSLAMTVSGQYVALADIGAAVLQMMARNSDVALSEQEAKEALSVMRTLAPHPDVKPALERLSVLGWRMATLTNSSEAGVRAQMAHAGLDHLFERQLSVESGGKFKPHASVYQWAAQEMKVEPSECMLIAAHGWDVAGAKWAGLQTAFIARQGQQKFPLSLPPDIDVSDLAALADALSA